MKMKLSKIALAVAALGTAPAAFALTPAQIAAGPTTYVWLSGNSAPSNGVFRSVMSLCNGLAGNAGTNDAHMYLESTGTEPGKSSGDRVAYACTMSSVAGSLAGKKVVVYHTVENGSFNAYAPHLSMAGEPNPNGYLQGNLKRVNDLAAQGGGGKCAAGAAGRPASPLTAWPTISAATIAATWLPKPLPPPSRAMPAGLPGQSYPDGGFSDTEYLINKQNLEIGTDLSAIGSEVATNIGQAFGVAVSYPLYYQLQKNDVAAGVLSAATCTSAFSAASPNTTLACQPNLPAQRYTAVAGQRYDRQRGRQPVRRPWRFRGQSGAPRPHFRHPVCFQYTLPCQALRHRALPRCAGTGKSRRQHRYSNRYRAVQHRRCEDCVECGDARGSIRLGCGLRGKYAGAYRHDRPLGLCQAESRISQFRRATACRGDGWLLQLLV